MTAFAYPAPTARRHEPDGYADYDSYRPWLRDEFAFRCVYCLEREVWVRTRGTFAVDHFQPVALRPTLKLTYANLLYSCVTCNLTKSDTRVPDPTVHLVTSTVAVDDNGEIRGSTPQARRIIDRLRLDGPDATAFRKLWLAIIRLAEAHDPDLFARLTGFPDDLPDLAALKPPANDRPEGVDESWLARRRRGELPATY
jgi:hypothetical protein